jgi:serine/threonine-protein kinase
MTSNEAAAPQQIRRIGHYQIFGPLGSAGEASSVWLARDTSHSDTKLVAVKRLDQRLVDDAEGLRSFLDEVRTVARLRHPNVVAALDFVEHERDLYMAMDYIVGVSVEELIDDAFSRKRRIPLDVVLGIAVGALEGVQSTHAAGVIHGNVAPCNLMIALDGSIHLLDFGTARALARYQPTLEVVAPTAVAPEHAQGQPPSAASDLFAVAMLMWHCLAGRPLFPVDRNEIAERIVRDAIPGPSVFNRTLSQRCDEVVLRALERAPERRFADAEEMASAIASIGKVASAGRIGSWLKIAAKEALERRRALVARISVRPPQPNPSDDPDITKSSEGEDSYRAATTQTFVKRPKSRPNSEPRVAALGGTPSSPGASSRGLGEPPPSQPRMETPAARAPLPAITPPSAAVEAPAAAPEPAATSWPENTGPDSSPYAVAQARTAGDGDPAVDAPPRSLEEISGDAIDVDIDAPAATPRRRSKVGWAIAAVSLAVIAAAGVAWLRADGQFTSVAAPTSAAPVNAGAPPAAPASTAAPVAESDANASSEPEASAETVAAANDTAVPHPQAQNPAWPRPRQNAPPARRDPYSAGESPASRPPPRPAKPADDSLFTRE